ncbi:MAG: tRNA 4-thiouridine(8) synthase ThiI [Clostridiales bacterium]|nr:tRNA 4-thiouridine(8) synthase ThiI [Clostridiales bacterium]
MKKVIIIRYAEIFLKGKNRGFFERAFESNLNRALKGYSCRLIKQSGRYLVEDFDEFDSDDILENLKKVFGVHTLSLAYETSSDLPAIFEVAKLLLQETGTFKVESHRGDKKYPLTSVEISKELGGMILDYTKGKLRVDVHKPSFTIRVDIRENGRALVFGAFIEGANGMPVGTAGKGLLLLSGGIDSPVAGHMMAKRGMVVDCLHFHSYPYTNMQAKEKVVDLAKILAKYTCGTTLYTVKVTHIQEAIHEKCKPELMITLLRRFMYRIAERHAQRLGAQCIITGESLGQVASQTIEGVTSSNSVVEALPVLRPLIGFDKNEIIDRSVKMGAYETSILPFEDCCTVFLPDFPATRPKLMDILFEERKLDVEGLIAEAFESVEKIVIE